MLNSMTGFGSRSKEISGLGKVSIELRSTNHKFLETVLHAPEGFLALEDRIKKEIESKIKRGRLTCVVNLNGSSSHGVFINEKLLKDYLSSLKRIKKNYELAGEIRVDSLVHLPGVISLTGASVAKEKIWPLLKELLVKAVDDLARARQKEGRALAKFLKKRGQKLTLELNSVRARFKAVAHVKQAKLKTPEERSSLLKDIDISEETERLEFHIKNFTHKLSQTQPVGKELDFIAQEMQREANTMGAKSCDSLLSARVVQIKSQIEKIREQVQNIE